MAALPAELLDAVDARIKSQRNAETPQSSETLSRLEDRLAAQQEAAGERLRGRLKALEEPIPYAVREVSLISASNLSGVDEGPAQYVVRGAETPRELKEPPAYTGRMPPWWAQANPAGAAMVLGTGIADITTSLAEFAGSTVTGHHVSAPDAWHDGLTAIEIEFARTRLLAEADKARQRGRWALERGDLDYARYAFNLALGYEAKASQEVITGARLSP